MENIYIYFAKVYLHWLENMDSRNFDSAPVVEMLEDVFMGDIY